MILFTHEPLRQDGIGFLGSCRSLILFIAALTTYQPLLTGAESDPEWLPAPGEMYSVDGHYMHIRCMGNGTPVVILESGLGGFSLEWTPVQESLAGQTRICAYDRAGYGWSEPGPSPRTTDQIVEELSGLLLVADVPPPYVLVGHSFGGYNVLYFAKVHSQMTAGIVLVDSSHPEQAERLTGGSEASEEPGNGRLVTSFHPEHLLKHYPRELGEQAMVLMATRKAFDTEQREFLNFKYSGFLVQQSGRLPSVPLVVVTRGKQEWPDNDRGRSLEQRWQSMQRDLVNLVPNARQVIAERSGHLIHLEQPEVVTEAIRSMLDVIRETAPAE